MTQADLIKFIDNHNFMVLATKGPKFPQSATVEYGNDGLTLIFDTNNQSRKFMNIQKSPEISAVIGWDEDKNQTVQYEGIAELLAGQELEQLKKAYFTQSPEAQKWETQPGSVYFKITPKWIRFTDLNTTPWTVKLFVF